MKQFVVKKDQQKSFVIDQPGQYQLILAGPGAQAELKGAFLSKSQEKKAVTVIIHHQAPHTRANTTLHGVAKDQARISFTGRIIIDENCGDSQSFLDERVLLLSDEAQAEAIPDLEIMADDVKCSHAASISKIPETQLFYLRSRGLSLAKAEELIVEGFLDL